MVVDRIENATKYEKLSPRLAAALHALKDRELLARPPGRYPLQGDALYAMIQDGLTKPRDQGLWEAHRRYIDVQYVVQGAEIMGYAPVNTLTVRDAYDAEKDVAFFDSTGSFLRVDAGMFVIFWPDDAHMPSLAVDHPAPVRKIVLKVLVP